MSPKVISAYNGEIISSLRCVNRSSVCTLQDPEVEKMELISAAAKAVPSQGRVAEMSEEHRATPPRVFS